MYILHLIRKLEVDDEEKEYFLKKHHREQSEKKSFQKNNKGYYIFHYKGMIDGEYKYELGEF